MLQNLLYMRKIATPTATEWTESSGSAKTSPHGLLTWSHLSRVLVTVPVYRPWHAPANIKRGAILVSLQECGFFLHRTTNSRKPMVKIRFAFVLSCEESQNCHWTQCVSTTSISKKRYYFCSLTLISLNTFLFARVRGPCSYTQNMFIVARLTLRLLRWRISEPNDYVC